MEPVALAGAAVVGIVVVSLLLIGLFSSRDENFEDHVAAQRAEQEASISSRSTPIRGTKTKKKFTKGKKKHADQELHEGEGAENQILDSKLDDENFDESHFDDATPRQKRGKKSEAGDDKPRSILKEQKKKAKKQAIKEELALLSERRAHFADESQTVAEQPLVAEIEKVVEASVPEVKAEPEPVVVEEIFVVDQVPVSAEPPVPKKPKKAKIPKEKTQTSGELSAKHMLETVKTANLNATEVQDLIDVLLNKQGESNQWKSTSKADMTDILRKQLQEKEVLVLEEQKQSLSTATKLKELREEVQLERLKQKNQFTAATNKITAQSKELQAMQLRMKATHDGHAQEVQSQQAQLRHLQDVVNSATMEHAQLKNASMRASQLNADKESLTGELNKLQQSHRQLKTDLAVTLDQLNQETGQRQLLEKELIDVNASHGCQQELAEKALSKRLVEVNDELKKAEARNVALSNTLAEKESTCKQMAEQLKNVDSKSTDSDSMNALTTKLTEATNRISELENMFTSVELQLKESQERQNEKNMEIEELERSLKIAHESPVQNDAAVTNHVNHTDEDEKPEKILSVSLQIHNDLLQEKDGAISKLNEELAQKDEEIVKMNNAIELEKKRNNDLRVKNWKAMDALSTVEQNTQSQINKAVEAAKDQAKEEVLTKNSIAKEKEESLTKLQEELDKIKEEFKKLEAVVEQQKKKNNELREKNWKAMDAVGEAEKSVSSRIKTAVQAVKTENEKNIAQERISTKSYLSSMHPDATIDSSLSYDKWLAEFKNHVANTSSDNNENEDLISQLEESKKELDQTRAECTHYKNGLEETEAMLRKLENQIETEIGAWEKKFEEAQQEMKTANYRISSLESGLTQAESASQSQAEKTKSLENEIAQARASECEAQAKVSSLEEELSKSNADDGMAEKLAQLEKELLESKENEMKSADAITKLELLEKDVSSVRQEMALKEKDMSTTVQQLSEVQAKLVTRQSEVQSLHEELKRTQVSGEEMKKVVVSLEEALTKAKTDLSKSQESLESINSSPEKTDKKKKGLKGALGKVKLGGSKKDKESKNAEKDKANEEHQQQLAAFQAKIEELLSQNKKLSESLQTEMTRSQQIEKDVAEAIADGSAKAAETAAAAIDQNTAV